MKLFRPAEHKSLLYRWHQSVIPRFTEANIEANDWAVFSLRGHPLGTLAPGRHTLDSSSIPFLHSTTEPDGNAFRAEVTFVRSDPFHVRIDHALDNVRDHTLGRNVTPTLHAEVHLQVMNPEQFIYGFFGLNVASQKPDPLAWITERLLTDLQNVLRDLSAKQQQSLVALAVEEHLVQEALHNHKGELQNIGMLVTAVRRYELEFSNEDAALYQQQRIQAQTAKQAATTQPAHTLSCPHCGKAIEVSLHAKDS